MKNCIDKKGNYQNVENLTLRQIYEEGYRAGQNSKHQEEHQEENGNGDE